MTEVENPCFHCYMGAIGDCIRCKYSGKWWSGDLIAETIEIEEEEEEDERMALFLFL